MPHKMPKLPLPVVAPPFQKETRTLLLPQLLEGSLERQEPADTWMSECLKGPRSMHHGWGALPVLRPSQTMHKPPKTGQRQVPSRSRWCGPFRCPPFCIAKPAEPGVSLLHVPIPWEAAKQGAKRPTPGQRR